MVSWGVPQEVTDVVFEVISDEPRWFSWTKFFWWAVYVIGFGAAAYQASDPIERVAYVVGAACISPFSRASSWIWAALWSEYRAPGQHHSR